VKSKVSAEQNVSSRCNSFLVTIAKLAYPSTTPYVFFNQIALLLNMKGFLTRATIPLQAFKDNLLFQTLFIGHRMVPGLFLSVKMPMFKDEASMSDDIGSLSQDIHSMFYDIQSMPDDKASMSDNIRSMSKGIGSVSDDIASMFNDMHSMSYHKGAMSQDIHSMFYDIHSMPDDKASMSDNIRSMSKDIRSLFEDIDSLSDDIAFRRALCVSDPLVRHSVRHFLLYLLLQYLPQ
jgi:hypothetical protein